MVKEFDANRIFWNSLSYETKNFFATVKTDVHLEVFTSEEIEQLLIPAPKGVALHALSSKIFTITVQSVFDPRIGSTDYIQSQVWCDFKNAAALQRVRLRQGKKNWEKTYRFTNNGVFRLRKKPNDPNETNPPIEHWTNIEKSFYPYDLKSIGRPCVLEPSALMVLVSLFDFSIGSEPLSLCVFNKKQLHNVQIRATELKRLKVNYIEKSIKSEVWKAGEIDSIKISFKTRSLAGENQKSEEFSFLGLKGDFDIYIDQVSKIPVLVSGKIPGFGKLDIGLCKVELKE